MVEEAPEYDHPFAHNFTVYELGIDEDIPKAAGRFLTLDITLPETCGLVFYCAYHLQEKYAGAIVVG